MSIKEEFQFLNSKIWLKYTQERYVPINDIKYRLESLEHKLGDWETLKNKIEKHRKLASVPLFMKSIDKNFWFFPSDSLLAKINKIERLGTSLYKEVQNRGKFKDYFLKSAQIEEAISSAIYEGANSTRAKAKELITSKRKPKNKDEWMLINNYIAMKWIRANSNKDVNNNLIKTIHNIVTKNTLSGDDVYFSGKFRDDKVFIGKHTGVEVEKIEDALNESIELSTNNKRQLHGLIKSILLHYFIAYIHPFFDGNGRTARSLFYFKAIKNGLDFVELLSISAHLKNAGNNYERAFDTVIENDNDVTYFVDFSLDSLLYALKVIRKKINFLFKIGELKEKFLLSSNQISLLQRVALNKFIKISSEQYALDIEKTREMGRKDLKDLFLKGFLIESKQGKKLVYSIKPKFIKEEIDKIK